MNSHTTYPKSGKISQVKGKILHKTVLILNTRYKFGCSQITFTLTSWLQMQGLHFPLRSDNSPERLTQLSKVLYLWLHFYYWKDRNQNQTKERCIVWGQRVFQKCSFLLIPEAHYPPGTLILYDATQSIANQGNSPQPQCPGILFGLHYVGIID